MSHPTLDNPFHRAAIRRMLSIRFVFQDATTRVAKLKSTVCQWAKRYKFPYAVGEVPHEWLTV